MAACGQTSEHLPHWMQRAGSQTGMSMAMLRFSYWVVAGQGGYGIQSAAGASALAASLIEGGALPDELTRHGVAPATVAPARLRAVKCRPASAGRSGPAAAAGGPAR